MYTIKAYVDGVEYLIHKPGVKSLMLGTPYFEVGDNINGQAEFTVYPGHPYYSKVKKLTTDIIFYNDGEEEFAGRVLYDDEDSKGAKKVFVEGELAFFCDSVQRPKVYHNCPVKDYLQDIIDIHNAQVEERKHFQLGRVTVTDPNDSLYRYSNWETTREVLKDKLTDRLGGHLVIRKENGIRFLDYLADEDYYARSTQEIRFGKNLLDFARNIDASDLATCIIPLGAKLDEEEQDETLQEQRLTIESVNGGVDYVTDDNAVKEYGKIFKTVTFDDVTVPSNLKTKGEEYLRSTQYEKMVLELTAIDLSLADAEISKLVVGNQVRCVSEPNALDSYFPLTKKKVYCTNFKKNTVTLGDETRLATYTSSNRQETADMEQTIKSLPSKKEILQEAIRDATDLINKAVSSGYAIHEPNEFIVADHVDYKNQAKYLWRWGLGGLAHYSEGYDGSIDGVALTMDGKINGKMLLVDSVYAEAIDIGYRTQVENTIEEAETAAKEYADGEVRTAKQTIETSITNLENRINMSVQSVKNIVSRKNYVSGGEQETLALDDFTISGSYATVEVAEFLNMKCLKLTFNSSGIVYLNQSVGTLPAGNYEIAASAAFPSGATATTYRPTYIAYGFSNSRTVDYFSGYTADEFHTFSKTVAITKASKTVSVGIYGSAGRVCYVTNIRCLRDMQELLDDLKADFTVGIGEVSAKVSDIYENSQHDYCANGDFSDTSDYFSNWYRYNSTQVTHETLDNVSCAQIVNSSTVRYYLRYTIKNQKIGPFRIRFKAACASGYESTARIRVYFNGVSKYTTAGELSTSFKTFEFDFSNVSATTLYCYFYNYVLSSTVYITDVEILGYMSAYSEAALTVLQDSITAEVERAAGAEATLRASIQVNADNITSCVTKNNVGSYITQYYNNVLVAFNNSSKYVQISAGAISIYNGTVDSDGLMSKFNSSGEHFYRDGYYVGKIGTNQWSDNTSHKGLVFDLEYQGKYMCWAQAASSSASTYTTVLTYSRANSIYTEAGLHAGCNLYGENYTLSDFKIGSISAGGYTAFTGAIPIVNTFTSSNGSSSWTYSKLRVYNGIIVGYWN